MSCEIHTGDKKGTTHCQIFEIGLGRTGTRSICEAVESLGFKVRHGFSRCLPCEIDFVNRYLRHQVDCDIYKVCDYSSNISSVHWEQLYDYYPNAKFVLPCRPLEKWIRSVWMRRVHSNNRVKYFISGDNRDKFGQLYRLRHFGMMAFDWEEWKKGYIKHYDEVKSGIEESKLLILDVFTMSDEELWERLCNFLDKPIPNTKFPVRHRWFRA